MKRSAGILDVTVDEEGAIEIARRSRGTPRLANRLLKRVRDWAQVRGNGDIDEDTAAAALSFFEVDSLGLDGLDNKILELLCDSFAGRPGTLPRLHRRFLKIRARWKTCMSRSLFSKGSLCAHRRAAKQLPGRLTIWA